MGKKKVIRFDPPKGLVYPDGKSKVNALRGEAIYVIANKIDIFRRAHASSGGQGKGASVKKGYAWVIDRGPVFRKTS